MNALRRQRGVSLVELMIGLTIGMFLLMGLSNLFVQSRGTYAYQQSQAGQQTNERLSTAILTTELQQAGYSEMTNLRILDRPAMFPATGLFGAGEGVTGTEATASVMVNGVGLQNFPDDTLRVRYWDGPGIVDCIGLPIPAATLSVDVISTDGINLNCSTNGGAARALLGDGQGPINQQLRVLGMAVVYGIDTNGDDSVDSYQRASGVADWGLVRIAEVELTIQSGNRPPETLSFAVTLENMYGAT